MRIILRAQAGPEIGVGHAMRCATLAAGLAAAGHAVVALIDPTPPFVDVRLDHPSIERVYPAQGESAVEMIRRRGPFDAVAFDGYGLGDEARALGNGPIIVMIDDNAELPVHLADVVLNQNLHADAVEYPRGGTQRWLLGSKFALLRPEVVRLARSRSHRRKAATLVAMGGTDPSSLSLLLVDEMRRHGGFTDVRVALGHAHPDHPEVARWVASDGGLSFADPDLTQAFEAAGIAIIGAGSTMWELALLATPSVAIVVADNQAAGSTAAQDAGFIECIDARDKLSTPSGRIEIARQAVAAAADIMASADIWAEMADAGRKAFDGFGTSRVVSEIEDAVRERVVLT